MTKFANPTHEGALMRYTFKLDGQDVCGVYIVMGEYYDSLHLKLLYVSKEAASWLDSDYYIKKRIIDGMAIEEWPGSWELIAA